MSRWFVLTEVASRLHLLATKSSMTMWPISPRVLT